MLRALILALALVVVTAAPAAAADPVVAAAGDIACGATSSGGACKQMATSDLLVQRNPAAVLPLGDVQYENGALSDFQSFYAPSWGRVLSLTHPAVGNHEYGTSGASGYWDYYNGVGASTGIGGVRGKGWYSFDVGAWHLVALNTNCSEIGGCGAGSAMETWFKADLAAHPTACTLVYAHHPRWTSDTRDFDKPELDQIWKDMESAGVELYLVGHSHFYERMAPARSDETIDRARGVRQIIAGTGGRNVYGFGTVEPISEVRNGNTFGVLEITLHPSSYDWNFVPIAGSSFTDSGSDTCHGTGSGDTTPPTAPANLAATAPTSGRVDLSWTGSSDNVGVTGYKVFRGGAEIATATGTSYSDTSVQGGTQYSYTVKAYDAAGNPSDASNTATVTTPAAPDTSPPSAPSGLSATASSSTQIDLSWTASNDNVGVTGYDVYRGTTKIGTATTTSYSDTGLTPATSYTYYVIATDAAANASAQSNTASATTQAAPGGGTTLTFTPTDDSYAEQGTTTPFGSASRIVTDNSPVRHMYLRFNVSGTGGRPVLSAKLRLHCVDPSGKGGDFRSAGTNWSESTMTAAQEPALASTTVASLGSVAAGNWYEVDVTSLVTGDGAVSFGATSTSSDGAYYDSKEGAAGMAPQLVLTLGAAGTPDTTPPTAPANLTGTAAADHVDLSWTASTDNVGVVRYKVSRNGTEIGTPTGTSYSDTTVQPNTSYQYSVVAVDAAGNPSDPSNVFTVTTPGASKVLTFTPTDDTYAQQDTPNTTYGTSTQIGTDNVPVTRMFARFVVSGVGSANVVSAKLRIYCVNPSKTGGAFHGSDPLWSQSSLTWAMQPTMVAATVATLGTVTSSTWYEVDVTPLVTGDGAVSIAATSTSSDGAFYASKERTGGFAPQLIVATG
jgi:chitodextrinase